MSETIAAISTALGEGGIGIVRVSGDNSLNIMKQLFRECPEVIKPRHAYFGHVNNSDNQIIDEAIFLYLKGPASYTGEDMLEIQAHGSNVSLKQILRAAIRSGARMAEPGEFTKLAFLNGKMDLSQAEAVIDIIKAKTDMTLDIAEGQKEGRLSYTVKEIRQSLLDILAQMAVNIDYPDEDIEQETYEAYIRDLKVALSDVNSILSTHSIGKIAREGIKVSIIGKPNVGKSSLMNALLGEGRVIVTDIPGTTRDTVEESANIDGIPIVLVDTAGIRDTDDTVERIGIDRTRAALDESDMAILVLDGSNDLTEEDQEVIDLLSKYGKDRILVVINKSDICERINSDSIKDMIPHAEVINTSLIGRGALDGARSVSERIANIYNIRDYSSHESAIVTNERHVAALEAAIENIEQTISMLENGEALEIAELNVHYAYDGLGSIIGEAVGDEILDTVFSKFCLGK